jgi:aconitate hydratase
MEINTGSTRLLVFASATKHAFKRILTSLLKPGGGEYGKFFSLPALNDPRIGKFLFPVL